MDNPAYTGDESLPRQNVKIKKNKDNQEQDGVFAGIFSWREIIQGLFAKHPNSVNVATVLTFGALFHAYFFYCLYRYNRYNCYPSL